MSPRTLTVKENVLEANTERAEANRRLLNRHRTLMLNIMSASGSGKTSLILQTVDRLKGRYRIAVIEGSVAASIDADIIAQHHVPTIPVNTAGGCHLDARMIVKALETLDLENVDLILVENVGNLVCTADFDLGAQRNAVILSVPEGDDKPRKYPVMFVEADVVLVNKIDVLAHFDFRLDAFPEIIGGLNPSARVFPVSAKTGEGMNRWFSWIEETLAGLKGV